MNFNPDLQTKSETSDEVAVVFGFIQMFYSCFLYSPELLHDFLLEEDNPLKPINLIIHIF